MEHFLFWDLLSDLWQGQQVPTGLALGMEGRLGRTRILAEMHTRGLEWVRAQKCPGTCLSSVGWHQGAGVADKWSSCLALKEALLRVGFLRDPSWGVVWHVGKASEGT